MSEIIRFFKYACFSILGLSLFSRSSFAADTDIYKRGVECVSGLQKILSDVNGGYYHNPLVNNAFCYYEEAGLFKTTFLLDKWYKDTTQEMNDSAALECNNQGRSAYIIELNSYCNYLNCFKQSSYICLNKSELDFSSAHGYFKNGVPEIVNAP
jgi:hypothetical protein